jgi:prokaryotic ubiquitin-like protein Pup
MAEQERKKKAPPPSDEGAQAEATKSKTKDTQDVDELLDEIDEVLETNAEEFVRSYIQKGGQAFVPLTQTTLKSWALLAFALLVAYLIVRDWRRSAKYGDS